SRSSGRLTREMDIAMRIAYVCSDRGVPVFGRKGCSIHVQEVLRTFLAQGERVTLIAANGSGERPTGMEPLELHTLPDVSTSELVVREQACLAANEITHEILKLTGPFDMVYERYSLWSYAGMEYARCAGIPGLLEVNAPLIEEQQRYRQLID